LRLDPISDAEAYAEVLSLLAEQQPASLETLDPRPHRAAPLALRIANLGSDQRSPPPSTAMSAA
jgi:hypothetical protein